MYMYCTPNLKTITYLNFKLFYCLTGQLGTGDTTPCNEPKQVLPVEGEEGGEGERKEIISLVTCGSDCSILLTSNGDILCTGSNR